jgi:hypothetical protein
VSWRGTLADRASRRSCEALEGDGRQGREAIATTLIAGGIERRGFKGLKGHDTHSWFVLLL